MIIGLEGVDGTGKTHFGRPAAALLGAQYAHTPSGAYSDLKRRLDGYLDPLPAFLMYLSSCADALIEGERLEGAILVLDRFWFSSVVRFGLFRQLSANDLAAVFEWVTTALPIPDLTILLTAADSARSRRFETRGDAFEPDRQHDAYWRTAATVAAQFLSTDAVMWVDTTSWSDTEGGDLLARRIRAWMEQTAAGPGGAPREVRRRPSPFSRSSDVH